MRWTGRGSPGTRPAPNTWDRGPSTCWSGSGAPADLQRAGWRRAGRNHGDRGRGARLTGRFAQATPPPARRTGLSLPRRDLDARLVARHAGRGARWWRAARWRSCCMKPARCPALWSVRRPPGDGPGPRSSSAPTDSGRSWPAAWGRRRYHSPRRLAFVAHVRGVAGPGPAGGDACRPAGLCGTEPHRARARQRGAGGPSARAGTGARVIRPPTSSGASKSSPACGTGWIRRGWPARSWSRARSVPGPAGWSPTARSWSATPRISSIPLPARGSSRALQGAELAAACLHPDPRRPRRPVPAAALAPYRRARRRAFLGKWTVERMIGYAMEWPALFDRAVGRIGRRGSMAHTLTGVTGDFLPASRVLNPQYIAGMLI